MEHKNLWFVDLSLYLVGVIFRFQPLVLRGVRVGFAGIGWFRLIEALGHLGDWTWSKKLEVLQFFD